MKSHQLKIDMPDGKWMVDIFSESHDNGVYDLVAPTNETEVKLEENHMYGLRYNLTGPENTPFTIYLDDKVLAEGHLDKTERLSGRGVL